MGLKTSDSMNACSNTAMLRTMCAISIAAISSFSAVTIIKKFPRVSMLLAISKWANSYLKLAAPLICTSRTAVLFTFSLAIVNMAAVHFATFVAKHFLLNTFISVLQIIYMLILPLSALNICNKCTAAYGRQVIVAINNANITNTLRFLFFAKLCCVASAVNLQGLPSWSISDGAPHYPIFLQAMGAFLTIQLGCAFFQVLNPTDLSVEYNNTLVGVTNNAELNNKLTMALAYLTMSLQHNPEMLREINAHPTSFRDAMIALHVYTSGDSESEVMRGILKMMGLFLSRGHTDVSALTTLKVLSAVHRKICMLDSELAFTDRQMVVS
jgi:hypothetical protein